MSDSVIFNATLGSTPFNVKDATDNGLLNKFIYDKYFEKAKNRAELAAFLMYMSNKNGVKGVQTVRPIALIGDEQTSTDVLSTTFNHGSATYLPLTNQTFRAGNYVVLQQEVSSGVFSEGMYKLTANYSGSGGYTFEIVSFRNTNVSGDAVTTTAVTFTTAAIVTIVASAVALDGAAPNPQALLPKGIRNVMQRIRESVSVGKHNSADAYIFDNGIEKQMELMYYTFMSRINNSLYFSHTPVDPTTTAGGTGVMGGLEYWLQPNRATGTHTNALTGGSITTQGNNYVQAGTTVDLSLMSSWLIDLCRYGGQEKHLFASPYFINKVFRAAMAGSGSYNYLANSSYVLPGSDRIWTSPALELSTGIIYLHPDMDLRGKKMWMQTSSNTNGYSSAVATDDPTSDFGVAIDPQLMEIVYQDVPSDGGVQSPKPHMVDLDSRNSNEVREWDTTISLMVKSCEGNGFYALKGS